MFIEGEPQNNWASSVGAKYYWVSHIRSYGARGRWVGCCYKHPAPTELNGRDGRMPFFFGGLQQNNGARPTLTVS